MIARPVSLAALTVLIAAGSINAGAIEVVFTNLPDHPSSLVPGADGERFRNPLAPFLDLHASPNGAHWIFKAFTDNPDTNANDVIVVGSGATGLAVAQEGDPAPIAGLSYGFMDSDCGINDAGQYAFGNRLFGGDSSTDEIIFKFDGTDFVTVAREGDLAPGLADTGPTGDEVFGNSLNSAHVMNTGMVGFRAQIENVDSDMDIALYHDNKVIAQTNTDSKSRGFDGFAAGTFDADADGDNWIVEGDTDSSFSTTDAAVLNGVAMFQEGDLIGDFSSPVAGIFYLELAGNSDWYVRGDNLDDTGWIVRNGEVLLATDDPITAGSDEHYTDSVYSTTFAVISGNSVGDYLVVGSTDADDLNVNEVVVMNGETVLARKGDPIDLNGDGLDNDDLYIGGFNAYDAFLTDAGDLYFFAALHNAAGDDLGDGFLRLLAGIGCPEDLTGDGFVDQADLGELLASYGVDDGGDIDGDGDTDQADLGALLGLFNQPCP
ncbi:MAG: hypothetical protein ACF8NJ_05010 [Phycisphaerales bacterium JB038]